MIILSIAVVIVICFSLYAYITINQQDINVTEAMQQTKQTTNKTIIEQKTLEQRYFQLAKNQLDILDQYKQLGLEQTEAFKKGQEKLNHYLKMSKLNIDKAQA